VLDEKITLTFGLSPKLVLGNIALQNAPWGSRPDMVTVKRLEIQVALLPLILGRIDIKRLVLIQPDILIETDRSGRSNLSFEGGRRSGSSSSKRMPSAAGPVKLPALTTEEVNVEQGQVVYRDGRTDKSQPVEILRLTAGADSAGSPIRLKLKSVYNDLPFKITGTPGPWAAFTSSHRAGLVPS